MAINPFTNEPIEPKKLDWFKNMEHRYVREGNDILDRATNRYIKPDDVVAALNKSNKLAVKLMRHYWCMCYHVALYVKGGCQKPELSKELGYRSELIKEYEESMY